MNDVNAPTHSQATKFGEIPQDWNLLPLGKIITLMTNGFVGVAKKHYVATGTGVTYLQGFNVQEGGFNFHGIKHVSEKFHAEHQRSSLRAGDMVTVQTGDIGLTAVVPPELGTANCHALIITRFKSKTADSRFYMRLFNSDSGRQALRTIETGTTMKHLNVRDMLDLSVPVPPLVEQSAIADAFEAAIESIQTLERLIAKKQAIKQGMMQQLLTGRTRLNGFSQEWDWQPFTAVMTRLNTRKHQILASSYSTVGILPVVDQGKKLIVGYTNQIDAACEPGKDGVVIFGDHTCITKFVDFTFVVGADGTQIVKANDANSTRFMAYALEMDPVQSTGYNRHYKLLQEKILPVPTRPEQDAITRLLMDADSEIEGLKARLSKAKAIKQGMTQELLTGRIRLPVMEPAS